MAEKDNLKSAKTTYETLCKALDHNDFHYKKDEENLIIELVAQGEDLPIEIRVAVEQQPMLIVLTSHLPVVIPEDKRLDTAVAISVINYNLVDGSFDFDIKSGHLFFRMSNSFRESLVGEDLFMYMVLVSCKTIDDFNDKLLMLSKGMMTLEQFVKDFLE